MAETTTTKTPAFTRDEMQLMADELTMGDVWRSQQEAPGNRSEIGMRSFWHSALRLELVAKDVAFEGFLDRVKSDDFRAVNADKVGPKVPDSEPKPG